MPVALALCLAGVFGCPKRAAKPTRVLIVVMDQMPPEYVDLFDMTNVRALMAGGTSYPNAYLGHMASETVISHGVMTSGLFPKHMGWSDEVYRDADNVLGRGAGGLNVHLLPGRRLLPPMTTEERDWWSLHGNEIVDTMAAPWAADVVGLLRDETSYGVAGDHGGAQRTVQRIPMVISGPGIAAGMTPLQAFRCVDILPTVLDQMGITPTSPLDGVAVLLPAPR